jgi:hypothetical protein
MDTSTLPLPHAREVEKITRRFRGGRRAFLVCVGASEGVRARVEGALEERLGKIAPARLSSETTDPWEVILGAREAHAQVVSVRLDDALEERVLRLLDVGRELLAGESVSLLLWISLGSMSRVASTCSNLWSYREDVAWFLSHEDIETSTEVAIEEIPAAPPLDEQLARLEERIAGQGTPSMPIVIERARLLHRLGRNEEARVLLTQHATEVRRRGGIDEDNWRLQLLNVWASQGRVEKVNELVELGRGKGAPLHRVLERVKAALLTTKWGVALQRLEQATASTYRWDISIVEGQFGPACAEGASALVLLGRLSAAERWVEEAQKAIRRRVSPWWPQVMSHVADLRALVAWDRLDAINALQAQQRAVRISQRDGALDFLRLRFRSLELGYAAMGLPDEREKFRERIHSVRAQMGADADIDAPRVFPVDTPFVRLKHAVEESERALNDKPPRDPTAHLDACASAWTDEDPRYRSLRLYDRWQRCLARHLFSRGEEAGAVQTLMKAAEALRDLPRTRLGMLLALAQLPTGEAFLPAREAAAMEVLALAMPVTSGALAEERDARRALASIARARGANDEADAQDAEVARIDRALA